jgi:anthranilate synthase/aminodeoxychorismate synthase-like glutamine amidotransferase
MLGVCLGHQTIAAALGARVVRAPEPMHGRTSPIFHRERGIFAGLPNPFDVCRYHSLVADESTLPDELSGTAWTSDGTLMALQHRELPVFGVQFHPEAILTTAGYRLLANFLRLSGLSACEPIPTVLCERDEPAGPTRALPVAPVTF